MKAVLARVAGFIFGLFCIGVIGLMVSLTYGALGKIFPGNVQNQMWGLVIYDIATLAWGLAFIFKSNSVTQYAASAAGFLVGLIGTLGMIAAEVMLSGAALAGGQIDTARIGTWMLYAFIASTSLHVILVYTHHGGAPEMAQQITTGVARGQIIDHALKDAEKQLEVERALLARDITADIMSGVRRDLQLIPAAGTPFQPRQEPRTYQLDGERAIYRVNPPHPTEPRPGAPDNYGPLWHASTDITSTLDSYNWVCQQCDRNNAAGTRTCSACGALRTNGSAITAFADQPVEWRNAGIAPELYAKGTQFTDPADQARHDAYHAAKEAGHKPSPFPGQPND